MKRGVRKRKEMKRELLRRILLPLGDKLSRQRVMEYYSFFEEMQWWPLERLLELQNEKLRETVRLAYNDTVFYRDLYERNGIGPENVRGLQDLGRLPIVTKRMLMRAYPDKCTRRVAAPWREYFTSGSSGQPFGVRISDESMSMARALMLLRARFSGWDFGDGYLQMGMTLDRGLVKRLKDILLNVSYVSAFDLSDKALDRCLAILEEKKHAYIMGYAASLYCIAKRAGDVGFNRKLRGIVSWGDNMFPRYRKEIERQFGCRVTDTYGCGEGIQIAAQCGCREGAYHVFMPHVIVEVVNDEGRTVVNEGGKIVVTRLDAGTMPFVRYELGDVGSKSDWQTCPCGRGLEMLKSIDGRDTDIVTTPNGNRLIVHFFTGIFEFYPSVEVFQVRQERVKEIEIKIVPRADFSMGDWNKIREEIHEKGDPDLEIRLSLVREIPLERSNKRRFVVSTVKREGETVASDGAF
jgi:phenylacetate-CoA ligase